MVKSVSLTGKPLPMPRQVPPVPSPRLSPLAVGLILAAAVVLSAAGWAVLRQRQETAGLRAEIASLTQAQRASASRESAAGAAISRLAETEAALAKARAELSAASTQASARIAELDHLVTFLRGEVAAAQQTIERMKADLAAAAAPPPAAKLAPGKK